MQTAAETSFVSARSVLSATTSSSPPSSRRTPASYDDDGEDDGKPSHLKPFKPPFRTEPAATAPARAGQSATAAPPQTTTTRKPASAGKTEDVHPRLKGIDPELVERIENEILEMGQKVTFDDISGLAFAKECIEELVVWPVLNPQLYSGLRQLPKGLLLFGPPGTGKTLIGKAIAHECRATFFSVSASSLTSKWIGEGEKTVRAMFAVAAARQPSVIFIDEIDSLLTQRSADENEASRRIKTEFLVQFDGAATTAEDVILVIGATNRPQELDEAARRRFVRRLYIPLPERESRVALLKHLLLKNASDVSAAELEELGDLTEGYSGADVTNLAREAAMGPLRDVMRPAGGPAGQKKGKISSDALRPINRQDFAVALKSVKPSVSNVDLGLYEDFNRQFGTQKL